MDRDVGKERLRRYLEAKAARRAERVLKVKPSVAKYRRETPMLPALDPASAILIAVRAYRVKHRRKRRYGDDR